MLLLCWSLLLLCLRVRADNVAVCREPGENVTLECSLSGCNGSGDGYVGMYLYRYARSREEVLYYHAMQGVEKISERGRYKDRIEKEGSLRGHSITISRLSERDSGVYSCVYKKTPQEETKCNVYTLAVRAAVHPPASPVEPPIDPPNTDARPPLALATAAAALVSVLLTLLFVKVLVPSVKHWTSSRRRAGTGSLDPSEYVYEVMTKNGLRPVAPNPYF